MTKREVAVADWSYLPDLKRDYFKPLFVQLSETIPKYTRTQSRSEGDPLPCQNQLPMRYDARMISVGLPRRQATHVACHDEQNS
jgi:hypothetical protein